MVDQNMNARLSNFMTERMLISHWDGTLQDPVALEALQADLSQMLTPPVLKHLPEALSLPLADEAALKDWIDARDATAQVYLLRNIVSLDLLGLLFLTGGIDTQDDEDGFTQAQSLAGEDDTDGSILRLGGLLAQEVWGQGYGTELVEGLMERLDQINRPLVRISVPTGNGAAARVLIKAGFSLLEELSDQDLEYYEA